MKTRFSSTMVIALLLCAFLAACSPQDTSGTVTVASKQFTENVLLSEMYAQLIESHTSLTVVRKQNMGATAVCFSALEKGEVDVYVEYTGTIYNELLKREHSPDIASDELFDLIKTEMDNSKNITVYETVGLNNTYALAMLRAKADALGVKTMSDLSAASPRLVFAANDLYYMRGNDGYDAMVKKYGMRFKSTVRMNNSSLYGAVSDDLVDVVVVYATDSLLPKYDMVILEDDRRMFPDYYALPIVRNDVLEKHPKLKNVLRLLTNRIDNKRMQELNYLVDIENNSPGDVVTEFLAELGLLVG